MTLHSAPLKNPLGALRPIPYMGVIFVVAEAMKLGFTNGDPDWCNLGQGQPEIGEMQGAPARIDELRIEPGDHAYGPIDGTPALRTAIAEHYNRLYRVGKSSRYGPENVSVAAGGRLMLSRVFAALSTGRLGYQVPDYTAYEDMIGYHQHRFEPIPIFTDEESGFRLPAARLAQIVEQQKLSAFLFSNPCNPTGQAVRGAELEAYVDIARKGCTMIFDEFYSHFIYDGEKPGSGPISAAEYVDDVENEPTLLIDGLTKNYRYPGWRVGWVVGPQAMVNVIGRAASAIDGGPSAPIQRAALQVLEPERADQETRAVRDVFSRKRNLMVERLARMGIRFASDCDSTFYVWGSVAGLPAPLNDPETFFRRALERKVMTVPGTYFDVNPGKRRTGPSPLASWMRFSFGPPEDNVRLGLDRLDEMIQAASPIYS
ncbi:MAG: aspartate/methionine/tyrosine aminotransferase [Planctomycetota bacterium]|jgi:aspartate/methionine/tyrosine aminotransferase